MGLPEGFFRLIHILHSQPEGADDSVVNGVAAYVSFFKGCLIGLFEWLTVLSGRLTEKTVALIVLPHYRATCFLSSDPLCFSRFFREAAVRA